MKKLNELSDGSCGRVVAINGDAHFPVSYTHLLKAQAEEIVLSEIIFN